MRDPQRGEVVTITLPDGTDLVHIVTDVRPPARPGEAMTLTLLPDPTNPPTDLDPP